VNIKHGVSTVTRGVRHTLGIVYHDAAVALLHQIANLQIDFRRLYCSRIELGLFAKIHFVGVRIQEVLFFGC
jgi:hypothetical protein